MDRPEANLCPSQGWWYTYEVLEPETKKSAELELAASARDQALAELDLAMGALCHAIG